VYFITNRRKNMVAIFVLFTILLFVGIDLFINRGKQVVKHTAKPEIYFHNFLPTPTMCDGGKLMDDTSDISKFNKSII
jgi:hypothetical protein